MKRNKELLVLIHLSQLLDLVTLIGGFITPLILWLLKKDEIIDMDAQGKAILNFRITMFICFLMCFPMVLFFGLGLLGFCVIGILYVVFPILNAIRVYNNQAPNYPLIVRFI